MQWLFCDGSLLSFWERLFCDARNGLQGGGNIPDGNNEFDAQRQMLIVVAEPDQHPSLPFEQAAEDFRLHADGRAVAKGGLNPFTRLNIQSHIVGLRAVVNRQVKGLEDLR